MKNIQKVIIDTDPGQDDAMALLMALSDDDTDILAVTTVCGNSTIENTTRNARYILKTVGRNKIPIYSGANTPLVRLLDTAVVHGESGLEGIDPVEEARLTGDAAERIIEIVRENPGEITLVALGPLTNIARAVQSNPRTMLYVKRIVIMGGAISVPGNKSSVAEFNLFVDPEAADIVMSFFTEITLVPLEICGDVTMTAKDFAKIRDDGLRAMLLTINKFYGDRLRQDVGVQASVMYDPVAMYCALYPEKIKCENMMLCIETQDDSKRGMVIVNPPNGSAGLTAKVSVITSMDRADFRSVFLRNINTLKTQKATAGGMQ